MRNTRIQVLCVVAMFVLVTGASHAQMFSVLYDFGVVSGEPVNIGYSVIAQGRDGSFYTTAVGCCSVGGTVFRMTRGGLLTVLHDFPSGFDGVSGEGPQGGLTLGADGNFYGTTQEGGTSDHGTIFKITPKGVLTVLYNFTGDNDGSWPLTAPIQATDGNFYGTTSQRGTYGYGTVYKISPGGVFTTIHGFSVNE